MVTIFENYSTPVDNKELNTILDEIKNGKFINEVNAVRQLYKAGNKTEGDLKKKKLQGFTPSATFNTVRKAHLAENYTHFIILDLDKLSESELKRVSNLATLAPYTYSSFVSPSGNGLKILVRVDTDLEHHAIAYNQVAEYYEQALEIDLDRSGKDVSRLCFYSYDPDLFLNTDADIYKVNKDYVLKVKNDLVDKIENEVEINNENVNVSLFQKAIDFTNKKESYIEGNRNNYIYLLASNCNRFGILESETENLVLQQFDLDKSEAIPSINSAYKNHKHEFAKFANITNSKNDTDEDDEFLTSTPTIPLDIYDKLPSILKEGAAAFDMQRERDTFLTGALAILSGCLPNVTGVYGQRTVYPHLFAFILAPAASGKGALQSSKALGDKYHDKIKNESMENKKALEKEMREYKKRNSGVGKNKSSFPDEEPPVEPPFKVVYIPANTSNAKIYYHLGNNDGGGIICETEADTLGNVFKQEWGSYSDMLRKAFHHERLSVSRKTNNEYIEVNNPRLAVALSGTPKQIFNIIASAEDGLFSRFVFYTFKTQSKWRSPSPYDNTVNLTELFDRLGITVLNLVEFLEKSPTTIHLTKEQWSRFNPIFEKYLFEINAFVSEDAESVVKRLGLILYRFCMIFTSLRKFENAEDTLDMICTEEDFESAITLADVYLKHSIIMFKNLPKQESGTIVEHKPSNKKQLLDALPDEFKRIDAITLGQKYHMKTRTIDLYLAKLLANKWLSQPRTGVYAKVKK